LLYYFVADFSCDIPGFAAVAVKFEDFMVRLA